MALYKTARRPSRAAADGSAKTFGTIMLKIASPGTRLSGLPTASMIDLGCTRLNAVGVVRSDRFIEYFVQRRSKLPGEACPYSKPRLVRGICVRQRA